MTQKESEKLQEKINASTQAKVELDRAYQILAEAQVKSMNTQKELEDFLVTLQRPSRKRKKEVKEEVKETENG